jgi:hypothetical protein
MEEATKSAVERIRILDSKCKKLRNKNTQTYEHLTEDPDLRKLQEQLQEAQEHALAFQA